MKTLTTFRIALLSLVLATSSLITGCGVGEASVTEVDNAPETTPVAVEIATPIRADIYATYSANASLSSDYDAPAIARVAGEIVELAVEEGDRVAAGQVLARMDGERLRLEMLAARANLDRAEKELTRIADLHARGLVSSSMFEGLKFDLDSLQAAYDLKQLNYEYSIIRAPIAGVVSAREVKLGQSLAEGNVAFRITETSELLAHLQIPQTELDKFSAGHAATVQVASMPNHQFAATIIRISPTVDTRNGTFRATAKIDNADGVLAPGMFGRFTVAYEKRTNALVIPKTAVLDEDQEKTVYVVQNGAVVRRVVETGVEEKGLVEILSGLQEYDEIVVVGHGGLRDGSKVLASLSESDRFSG
ncbi:MAG: efflux RND transporter periplasmic adaptor subunit [Gammaproteobacteria bacterium]|nr:efflux RND transporter periplasmic adaptor subunit [Gammaproteobacteria bacterium]MDH5239908.1 efflux RND transporter periplasmic adaptor subunit [Gammaproteobacteria bacterium]MDH5260431.1 efflux RND transporter periplasmic adaptor subunit [Gammaproteobacteria bacterium]MDH5582549.1 efflux RND transporter periplasmic adaptor subunit [Gammaproteobacteria bacterium]